MFSCEIICNTCYLLVNKTVAILQDLGCVMSLTLKIQGNSVFKEHGLVKKNKKATFGTFHFTKEVTHEGSSKMKIL